MDSERFLVTGARQKEIFGALELRKLLAGELHGEIYNVAVLAEIDFAAKRIVREYAVERADFAYNVPGYATNFTVPAVDGDTIHLPSHATIHEVSLATFEKRREFSMPLFNDLHSVALRDGEKWVTSTGLDAVLRFRGDDAFDVLATLDGVAPPSRAEDWRARSTKPHKCHPNHVAFVDGRPWVTRARQGDCAPLDDLSSAVKMADVMVHDGVNCGDGLLHFTSVNGHAISVDPAARRVVRDLPIRRDGYSQLIGWCRGLHVTDRHFYVGFSVLRRTKHAENVQWLKAQITGKEPPMPTRIEKIDRETGELVDSFEFQARELSAIFWLAPA